MLKAGVFEPVININYKVLAQKAKIDKGMYQNIFMSICQVIGELLNEKKGVQIDLQYIGKFFGKYRVIRFDT